MKRIYRSRQDRMVCGVCGGIAEYFDLDPSLVRLGWIIFSAMGGSVLNRKLNTSKNKIKLQNKIINRWNIMPL